VRATVDDLASPHPLGHLLPGLYHDNDLAQRFTGALDVVLAPVLATLDSSDAYVDPLLAPLDFVEWLAEWVGVELDASWPEARQRALVARAAELYAWRGTVRGVTEAVAIYTGVEPEVSETGGTAWTGTPPPSGALPGSPAGLLLVRVRVAPDEPVDAGRLDRLVAAAKPAHIAHRVEIVEDRRLRPREVAPPEPAALPVPDDVPDDLDGEWPGGDDDFTVTSARGIAPTVVPGTEVPEEPPEPPVLGDAGPEVPPAPAVGTDPAPSVPPAPPAPTVRPRPVDPPPAPPGPRRVERPPEVPPTSPRRPDPTGPGGGADPGDRGDEGRGDGRDERSGRDDGHPDEQG